MQRYVTLAIHWLDAHPLVGWILLSLIVLPLLRSKTPEQWVALAERSPRAQGFIKMLRGAGFDPAKVIAGFVQWVTGKVPPRPGGPAGDPTAPYRITPAAPPPPRDPPMAARVGLAALALALALVGGALAASCSGSWEQRAHRALVATAHAVAVADDTAAQAYQVEAHAADGGAEFARIDDRYRRIQGAEEALSATLVRAEALLDAVHDAGGDAGTARCLALRALVQLAADARVFGGVLTAAGVTLSADQAAIAHGVAAVIDEMAPRCEGSDAGSDVVTTDAGGDSDA